MRNLKALAFSFVRDEKGATAVEYGIMVAAIAAVIIGAVVVVGSETNDAFVTVGNAMQTQLP